jgi:PIN domain nuclease of toxin-antitoxin system
MRLLLDSHVFVWLLFDADRVGPETRKRIGAAAAVYVSSASLWELALKYGKQRFPHPPDDLVAGLDALHVEELPVLGRHLVRLPDVALAHRDAFDAVLVAQTLAEEATLVTADSALLRSAYPTHDAGH